MSRPPLRVVVPPKFDMRAIIFAFAVSTSTLLNIMSANAEIEEVKDEGGFASSSVDLPASLDFIISLLANNDDIIGNRLYNYTEIQEYSKTYAGYAAAHRRDKSIKSENLNSSRSALIPDAVWSFDASPGAELDHIISEHGLEFDTLPQEVKKDPDFSPRESLSLSVVNNSTQLQNLPVISPITIQVASCGGGSAEHIDLEYCDISANSPSQPISNYLDSNNNGANPIMSSPDTGQISPNTTSTSSQGTQYTTTTSAINNEQPKGVIIDLSDLSDQCVDTSLPCMITPIALIDSPSAPTDPLSAPIDSPIPPTDFPVVPDDSPTSITASTPVIPIGNLAITPQPLITPIPPLVASPVPETSTWIMLIIGFGVTIVARRRRVMSPVKRRTVWPFHRSPNGQ